MEKQTVWVTNHGISEGPQEATGRIIKKDDKEIFKGRLNTEGRDDVQEWDEFFTSYDDAKANVIEQIDHELSLMEKRRTRLMEKRNGYLNEESKAEV